MKKVFQKIEWLNEFLAVLVGVLTVIIMLIVTASVIARYFFQSPFYWSTEVCQFLLLWCVFMGLGYTTMVDGHVKVDIVLERLSPEKLRIVNIITTCLAIIYGIVITRQTFFMPYRAYIKDWHSSGLLELYLFPIYLILPIGCLLLTLQLIINLYKLIINEKG